MFPLDSVGHSNVEWVTGSFKTPALRGLAWTAPYGHAGTLPTLADAVRAHALDLLAGASNGNATRREPWLPTSLDDDTIARITTFLGTLRGTPVIP